MDDRAERKIQRVATGPGPIAAGIIQGDLEAGEQPGKFCVQDGNIPLIGLPVVAAIQKNAINSFAQLDPTFQNCQGFILAPASFADQFGRLSFVHHAGLLCP